MPNYIFLCLDCRERRRAGVCEGGSHVEVQSLRKQTAGSARKGYIGPRKPNTCSLSFAKSSLRKLEGPSTQVLLNSLQETEKGTWRVRCCVPASGSKRLLPCLFLKGRLGHPYRKKKSPLSKLNLPQSQKGKAGICKGSG